MYDTLDAANGAGLAANQVGVNLRIFVYDCAAEDEVPQRGVVINPVLEKGHVPAGDPDPEEGEEGCLSIPGEHFPTPRSDWARVTGTDLTATRSSSRRRAARSRGACSTRPTIWTASCMSSG